jgi:ABC-type dipeptide/oligopeptide/nickel transport system permease component
VTLTAVFTLLGSLLADILHALLDPRLRVQP